MIVTLRPHLPIRGKPVKIDVASPSTKLIDEICVVGDKEGFEDCGMVFEAGHRVGRPLRFKLMTGCGTGDKSENLDATYQLQNSFFNGDINSFWAPHEFPIIKVWYVDEFRRSRNVSNTSSIVVLNIHSRAEGRRLHF